MNTSHNLFNSLQKFEIGGGKQGEFYSLPQLEKAGVGPISKLPISLRLVLESLLRNCDGKRVSERNVRELAEDTGTRATTLTGVLDRLERRGYLTRELDPADRRSFRLTLTAPGRAAARKVRAAVTDLEADALAGVSARQLAGYHAVVSALQEVC